MKKRGFTLIELLAVIVILAVIVLIAVPIVLNLIEKSKEGAFKDSAYAISKAADNYYVSNYSDKDKITNKVLDINDLEYTGNISEGTIVFNSEGNYAYIIIQDEYCAYKYASSTGIFFGSVTSGICVLDGTPISMADLITATIDEVEDGIKTGNSSVSIMSDGTITYTEDDITTKYIVTSDGTLTRDGNEITDSIEKDEEYTKLITVILSDPVATEVLLDNQILIDGFKSNEAAMNTMLDGFVDYYNAQYYLQQIKDDIIDIQSKISYLNGGTASIQEGTDSQAKINNYITTLNNITGKSDIIIETVGKIIENSDFVTAVFSLPDASGKLLESSSSMLAMVINDKSRSIIVNNSVAMDKILNSTTALSIICSSANGFAAIANDSAFMKYMVESQNARTAIYDNYKITESILISSSVAQAAMKASSRYASVSVTVTNSGATAYSGKAFIFTYTGAYVSKKGTVGIFADGTKKTFDAPGSNTMTVNRLASSVYLAHTNPTSKVLTATIFKI